MLKNGETVLDCQVIELLLENDVYQCYLMNCSDSALSKLIVTCPDPLFDQSHQTTFFEHVEWLASQTFPWIGTPLKSGSVDGQPACLYPVPTGLPLEKNLSEEFTPRQIVQLINDIADSLSAPHSAGLSHGNLTPETIHLDGATPFLADFALGQLLRIDYQSGINPHYTSPEQVRGETPGAPADIYSLGCVFYRLLTGQTPFPEGDPFSIAKQHLLGEFPPLPENLSTLQPIIDSLVRTAATERTSAEELTALLEPLLSGSEIDQLVLPPQENNSLADEESNPTIASTVMDEDTTKSDIAARVEERLKEHGGDFQIDAPIDIPSAAENDTLEISEPIEKKSSFSLWRSLIALLLGMFLGGGIYYFMNGQIPDKKGMVVPVKVEPASTPAVPDLNAGLTLWQKNDLIGAETQFKKAIETFPNDPRVYNNLAAFYAAQGNYEQARDYLEKALATDKEYETVYHNLGAVYAEMARGSYGRALQLKNSQQFISLPVFSAEGIENIGSASGEEVAVSAVDTSTPAQIAGVANVDTTVDVSRTAEATVMKKPTVEVEKEQTVPGVSEPVESETNTPLISALEEAEAVVKTEDVLADNETSAPVSPEAFLQNWAAAWSSQNVDDYLAFYGDKFIPPAGRTRPQWKKQRHQRLTAPKKITVSLDNFKVTPQSNDKVKVETIQSYQSDVMSDKTRKVFDLQHEGQSWKIIRERSLGAVR